MFKNKTLNHGEFIKEWKIELESLIGTYNSKTRA